MCRCLRVALAHYMCAAAYIVCCTHGCMGDAVYGSASRSPCTTLFCTPHVEAARHMSHIRCIDVTRALHACCMYAACTHSTYAACARHANCIPRVKAARRGTANLPLNLAAPCLAACMLHVWCNLCCMCVATWVLHGCRACVLRVGCVVHVAAACLSCNMPWRILPFSRGHISCLAIFGTVTAIQ